MRSTFARLVAIGTLFLTASLYGAERSKHPNILFLMADEFRHDCLSVAGHPVVKTPYFDKLAAEGARLTNAYVASPVCSPSRATLFTGRYPQHHGVTANSLPFAQGEVVLPQILKAHGYTTGLIGKLHLQERQGWFDLDLMDTEGSSEQYRQFLKSKGVSISGQPNTAAVPETLVKKDQTPLRVGTSVLPEELFPETWQADRAIDFIREQKDKDKPFFLYVSMYKPHSEFVIPKPFAEMYAGKELLAPVTFKPNIGLPADFKAGDDEDNKKPAKPGKGAKPGKEANPRRADGPGSPARLFISDPELLSAVQSHYYGAVSLVDKQMGRIVAALDEAGLKDNTIIVFTSDHGNMLGERNRMFKGVMYESSARVPMLYRGPGIKPGQVDSTIVDNATVMPTLMELAGLPVPAGVQGVSLSSMLAGKGAGPGVAYAYLSDKMVRKGDWKLIVPLNPRPNVFGKSETPELYNVVKDPNEQANLYGTPEGAAAQEELTQLMEKWIAQKPAKIELPK